jgi:hypothetical protein
MAAIDWGGEVAADLNLKAEIPPMLIVHTEDDQKFILGSKTYHVALDDAKFPNDFLLYPTRGRGYGLSSQKDAQAWPQTAMEWLHKVVIH